MVAPTRARGARWLLLAGHLLGHSSRASVFRNRLRARPCLGLSAAADHSVDLSVYALVQQSGGVPLDVFPRTRSGAASWNADPAREFFLRPFDTNDGQFVVDGPVLQCAHLRGLRLGFRRQLGSLCLDYPDDAALSRDSRSHRHSYHSFPGLFPARKKNSRRAFLYRLDRFCRGLFSLSLLPTRTAGRTGILRQFHAVFKRHGDAVFAISAEQLVGRNPRGEFVQPRNGPGFFLRSSSELCALFSGSSFMDFRRSLF